MGLKINRNIIIFCQSPYHAQFVVQLIELNSSATIDVYVVNVEGIYTYLKSLQLDLNRLIFISAKNAFSLKKVSSWKKERRRLLSLYDEYFSSYNKADVYYFSNCFDWVTAFFVSKLSKNNNISFFSVEEGEKRGTSQKSSKTIIDLCTLYVYRYITGINFQWLLNENGTSTLYFPYRNFGIKKQNFTAKKGIDSKYLYHVNIPENKKAILLIETNLEDYNYFDSYEAELTQILNYLKEKEYLIYLKGHPRCGATPLVHEYVYEEIPQYVVGEFLDISKFSAVIGVFSSGLSELSKRELIPVISTIHLHTFKEIKTKKFMLNFLSSMSGNKILFPNKIEDIKL